MTNKICQNIVELNYWSTQEQDKETIVSQTEMKKKTP